MKLTEDQGKEFEELSRPLIKWLNENASPHAHIIIETTYAELSEGKYCHYTEDYVKG